VLKVDSAAAVSSGTVDKKDADKIVKEIKWTIKQGGLFRSDILLLDLIASNNWKRPIYFANPNSVSKVLDVDKYCHLEGVVYRFKPVKAMDYIRHVGGVDAGRSYKILTDDEARWGRLNEPDVNVDRESFRNATIAKQSYIRAAQALVELHQYDSAVKVLDKGIEFFPNEKFPFDYYTSHWAMLYYQAGATEKANKVVEQIFQRYLDDLGYYNSLDNKFLDYYSDDIRMALTALQQLAQLAKDNGQKELGKKLDKTFKEQLGILKH
jgi:tetratricopeptide (TPR) repeat protein